MRSTLLLVFALALGLLAPLPSLSEALAEGKATRSDIIPVDQIKPGMKGYGLTVFEGTEPEKFDVEVIDVLKNFRPRQELILIKTRHPRLDVAKVVAGMSGSPIYLNGKMAGAYAYGWTFGEEPVAGVTPIRSMLDDLERPLPKWIHGWPLTPAKQQQRQARYHSGSLNRFAGEPGSYDVLQHARQIQQQRLAPFAPGSAASNANLVRPVATPILMGGMSSGAVEMATELLAPLGLEPLQAGGGGATEPNAPRRYVDGGAVGIQLIRGDMSAMGLGTVTRVEGDKLLAFGHPMMNSGVTAMPAAVGRVLWFLASKMRSFKIGMPARPVGALVNDRMASIVLSHTIAAPTIPVSMRIKGAAGAPYTKWDFEVAHEKFMTPSFVAVALGNALQAAAAERQDISWNSTGTLAIKGHGKIALEDFGVAIGGTPDPRDFIRSNLLQSIGAVLNNPWESARIESVDMEIELRYAREIVRLRGVEVLDPEVDAGQSARIRLTLVPFAGKTFTKTLRIPIPAHLAGETLRVSIKPGYMVEKEQAAPDTLEQLIRNFEDPIYPPQSVVLAYKSGSGVAFKGRVAHILPPGAVDAIQPHATTIAPQTFGSETRHVTPLSNFMVGDDQVTITVRPVLR